MDKALQQFREVALLKNVSNAAKKLCLSQPALTHSIKKLEESMGVLLFDRTPNGVTLTEYGEILLEQANIVQRLYENTKHKIDTIKEKREHEIRIGSGHAWWYLFLRRILGEYQKIHPTANIHVDIGNHLRQMDILLSGDTSFFIGHEILGLSKQSGVHFLPLFLSHDGVFVRPGHPLLGRPCTHDDLFPYPLIELTPDEKRHAHVVEDFRPKDAERVKLHLTERTRYRSNSIMTCIDIAKDTDGILPLAIEMAGYFRDNGLEALTLAQDYGKGTVGIYVTPEARDDPRIRDILAQIQNYAHRSHDTSGEGDGARRPLLCS